MFKFVTHLGLSEQSQVLTFSRKLTNQTGWLRFATIKTKTECLGMRLIPWVFLVDGSYTRLVETLELKPVYTCHICNYLG